MTESRIIVIKITAAGEVVRQELIRGEASELVVEKGDQYRVVDQIKNGKETPKNHVLLQKEGGDLVLIVPGERSLRLEGFYNQEQTSIFLIADDEEQEEQVEEMEISSASGVNTPDGVIYQGKDYFKMVNDNAHKVADEESDSDDFAWGWGWGGIPTSGIGVGVLAAFSGGGGGNGAPNPTPNTEVRETTVTGTFSAGKYVSGTTDNAVTIMKADGSGTVLGKGKLDADGSYTITLNDGSYNGSVTVKLEHAGIKYNDEAGAADKSLSTDLYAMAVLSPSTSNTIHINPQTTIAAEVIGMDSSTDLKEQIFTKQMVNEGNEKTTTALGLTSSVITTKVDTVDSTGDEDGDTVAGHVAAAISGVEKVAEVAEVDADTEWDTTTEIISKIATSIKNTSYLTKEIVDKLAGGFSEVETKIQDETGVNTNHLFYSINTMLGEAANQSPITDTGFTLSADTGKAGDLVTSTVAQTITAELSEPLKSEQKAWVSLDDGETWTDTTPTSGKAISWTGDAAKLSEGTHSVQLVVSTATTSGEVLAKRVSAVAESSYTLNSDGPKAPTVNITDSEANSATGDVTYTFTFDKKVAGFEASDVSVTGGTAATSFATTSTDGKTYTLVVTPTANTEGDITVNVSKGVAQDSEGSHNVAATQVTQTIDTKAPTLAITDSRDTGTAKAGEEITYTFTFDEAVMDIAIDDIDISNGTIKTGAKLEPASGTDAGKVYTLIVIPDAGKVTGTDILVTVAANKAIDVAGNSNVIETYNVQAIDTKAPNKATIELINDTGTSATDNITQDGSLSDEFLEIVFTTGGSFISESTTQTIHLDSTFKSGDTVWVKSIEDNTTCGIQLQIDINPDNTVTLKVLQSKYNFGSDLSADFDKTGGILELAESTGARGIGFSSAVLKAKDANGDEITSTINSFITEAGVSTPDAITELVSSQYFVTKGSDAESSAMTKAQYQTYIDAREAADDGDYTVRLVTTDYAGNTSETIKNFTLDTKAPTVTITNSKTTGTAKADEEITYTFTFDEAVTDFVIGDIDISNGTIKTGANLEPVSSAGNVYTLMITPDAGKAAGTNMTVAVAANKATDAAGNNNVAATDNVQAIDTKAPTLTITDNKTDTAKAGEEVTYTFTFDETVTDFTANDVSLASQAAQ